MRHVSYAVNSDGYIIRVYEDEQVKQEYAALVPTVLAAIFSDQRKIKSFAKTTALIVARDFHVNKKYVHYDMALESLIPNNSQVSITVLSDGETFTGTAGCEVVEYDEQEASEFEDADDLVPYVLNGQVKGHIYSIPALVALYKVLLVCRRSLPKHVDEKLDDVEQVSQKGCAK